MQLVDSYLSEVGRYLPRKQRDDIVGELRDDIVEQMSARADTHDRLPDEADERQVLEGLGHPLKVASAYRSRSYLIGPALYPAYLQTLRTTLLTVLAVVLLVGVARNAGEGSGFALGAMLDRALEPAMWVLVIVTLVFYSLEASGDTLDWYHNWSPESLRGPSASLVYGDVVTNLVFEGAFLVWWNSLISLDWKGDSEFSGVLSLTPVWDTLFWPLNLLIGVLLLLHVYVLIRSVWQPLTAGLELGLCVALLVVIAVLLGSGALIEVSSESGFVHAYWADRVLKLSLLVIAGFTIWDGVLAYGRVR